MKKIITVLTSVVLLLMGTKANFSYANSFNLGDVNMDGSVDAVDASAILTYYAVTSIGGEASINVALADFDRNGRVDAIDASAVLTIYAKAATGKVVTYETVSIDDELEDFTRLIPSKTDAIEFGSVLRFNKESWTLHSKVTDALDSDLYEPHPYIYAGDDIVIVGASGDGWYKILFPENVAKPEHIYIYISDVALANKVFEKIGENKFLTDYNENLIASAVETTVTTTCNVTETTTTTTTAVVTNTTAETTSFPYATSVHSIIKSKSDEIGFGTVLMFGKDSWTVHSCVTDNMEGDLYEKKPYIHKGCTIVLLNDYGDGWYKVCFDADVRKPPQMYVFIPDEALQDGTFRKIGENGFLSRYIQENNLTSSFADRVTTTTTTVVAENPVQSAAEPTTEPIEVLPVQAVAMDPIPSERDGKLYRYDGAQCYIHTQITTESSGYLYAEKSALNEMDKFFIDKTYFGGWYKINIISASGNEDLYIYLSDEDFDKYCVQISFKMYE